MSIIDKLLEFSDAQALTATGDSDNSIDLGNARQVGVGNDLYLVVRVDVAADAGSANETYTVQLETDDNSGFTSGTLVGPIITIPRGSPAGYKAVATLPRTGIERYLQAVYTLGGTTPSVTLSTYITPFKEEDWTPQPEGQN